MNQFVIFQWIGLKCATTARVCYHTFFTILFAFARLRSDEELTPKKSALKTVYSGLLTLSTQLINQVIFQYLPQKQDHSFFGNLSTFFHFSLPRRCLEDFKTIRHGCPLSWPCSCLEDFNTKSESSVSRRVFLDNLKVSKAPLAGDIIWEHLSVGNKCWWVRAVLINTSLFGFVLIFTTPAVVLSSLQELKATIGE